MVNWHRGRAGRRRRRRRHPCHQIRAVGTVLAAVAAATAGTGRGLAKENSGPTTVALAPVRTARCPRHSARRLREEHLANTGTSTGWRVVVPGRKRAAGRTLRRLRDRRRGGITSRVSVERLVEELHQLVAVNDAARSEQWRLDGGRRSARNGDKPGRARNRNARRLWRQQWLAATSAGYRNSAR